MKNHSIQFQLLSMLKVSQPLKNKKKGKGGIDKKWNEG